MPAQHSGFRTAAVKPAKKVRWTRACERKAAGPALVKLHKRQSVQGLRKENPGPSSGPGRANGKPWFALSPKP